VRPLNQYVLADALGLSAIHVDRVLQQLRQKELLSYKANRVTILDARRLKKLAGF
jgi:DNA-binding GntR family transcriptional regulator